MKRKSVLGLGLAVVLLGGNGCGTYRSSGSHHSRDWAALGFAAKQTGITNADPNLFLIGDAATDMAHFTAPFDAVREAEARRKGERRQELVRGGKESAINPNRRALEIMEKTRRDRLYFGEWDDKNRDGVINFSNEVEEKDIFYGHETALVIRETLRGRPTVIRWRDVDNFEKVYGPNKTFTGAGDALYTWDTLDIGDIKKRFKNTSGSPQKIFILY